MPDNTLLDIRDLSVEFLSEGRVVKAVNHVNFHIRKGETVGLVGETGAGKTTTALAIMRLLQKPAGRYANGEIVFEGEDLLTLSESRMRGIRGKKISMIFQDPMTSLDPVQTVGEQIAEVVRLHEKLSRLEAMKRAYEALELVGISAERADEYPHQFSGGMKQRVCIAMALAANPMLLIADEPTTALDVTIQAQVLHLMQELKEKLDTAMILITHDLGIVAEACDKVAIMYAGEIIEFGTLEEIFHHPTHPYTIGLFNAIPKLNTKVRRLDPIKGLMPDPANLPEGCSFSPRCPYATKACAECKPQRELLGGEHYVSCIRRHELDKVRKEAKG